MYKETIGWEGWTVIIQPWHATLLRRCISKAAEWSNIWYNKRSLVQVLVEWLIYTWILVRKKIYKRTLKNYKKVFLFCSTSFGVFKDRVLLWSPYFPRNYTVAQAVLESLWLPSSLCWDSRSSYCLLQVVLTCLYNLECSQFFYKHFTPILWGEFLFLFVYLFVFLRQGFFV